MAKVEPVIIDATPTRINDDATPKSQSSAPKRTPLSSRSKWKRAAIGLLAILYVLSPLDLVPDVIPIVGWLDDLGVLAWAARQVFFKRDA
jgi:uncharacterized membrane protein YkvA (DUF1232 family)